MNMKCSVGTTGCGIVFNQTTLARVEIDGCFFTISACLEIWVLVTTFN